MAAGFGTNRLIVGPQAGLPAGPRAVGIPAFGGQLPAADRRASGLKVHHQNNRSKKGYTGTRAGLGRNPRFGKEPGSHIPGPVFRQGPKGPGGARFESVRLPNRSRPASPPAQPSLLTRIGHRMRRAAGAFGF